MLHSVCLDFGDILAARLVESWVVWDYGLKKGTSMYQTALSHQVFLF